MTLEDRFAEFVASRLYANEDNAYNKEMRDKQEDLYNKILGCDLNDKQGALFMEYVKAIEGFENVAYIQGFLDGVALSNRL